METRNPYDILGIKRGASTQEIQHAWRRKVRSLHPDVLRGRGESEEKVRQAEEQLKDVNWAYEELSDPQKRQRYENPPIPHVEPSTIRFTGVAPGTVQTASFVVSNTGGPLFEGDTFALDSMEPWAKIVDAESLHPHQPERLPLRLYMEVQGSDWARRYAQTIDVRLGTGSTQLFVELQTKAEPAPPPRMSTPYYGTRGTYAGPRTAPSGPRYQAPPQPQPAPSPRPTPASPSANNGVSDLFVLAYYGIVGCIGLLMVVSILALVATGVVALANRISSEMEGQNSEVREQRNIPTPVPLPSKTTFTVTIDYTLSFEQAVALGRYRDNFGYGYPEFDYNTSPDADKMGQEVVEIFLLRTPRRKEIFHDMDRMGLRPARTRELLAFGAQYQDEQLKCYIMALGSVGQWMGFRTWPTLGSEGPNHYQRYFRGHSLAAGVTSGSPNGKCFLAAYK